MDHFRHVVWGITEGRFSLRFVIVASLLLLFAVVLLSVYMLVFRGYQRLRRAYRASRAAIYHPAIEQVLMEEPYETILATLRPRRWGDLDVVQEVMIDSMRHLEGPPFDTLRRAADELGLVEYDIARTSSTNRHARGRAMDALGVIRPERAVPVLLAALEREPLDLKLVALRALAAIGDASVLPEFLELSDRLPPTILPRLVSLAFEFQAPGRRVAMEIINKHPTAFPPAAVRDILMELASEFETAP